MEVGLDLAGRGRLILGHGLLYVLGHVHEHGAGAAGRSDEERLAQRFRQAGDVLDHVVVLGDGHCHARDIHFLEGVAAQRSGADVARDGDHGHAVHERRRDPRDEVGRARAGGRDDDARLARGAGVAVRGVGRALFVAGEDLRHLIFFFIKRVEHVQDGPAGISEHGVHALFFDALDDDL